MYITKMYVNAQSFILGRVFIKGSSYWEIRVNGQLLYAVRTKKLAEELFSELLERKKEV